MVTPYRDRELPDSVPGVRPSMVRPPSFPPHRGSGATVSAIGSGLSARGMPPVRIPRTRAGFTRVLAGVAVLAVTAALVFFAQNTGSSRAWFPPLHDRSPVAVTLMVIAAAGWECVLTLAAVRVVQARQIMRRHRLEKLATTLSATGPDIPGSSFDGPHPQEQARET
jgi:uncharacterized integral membrane protein